MKYKFTIFLFFCFTLIAIISCKKETDVSKYDIGYDYFPNEYGNFVIYKVDSVLFNDFDNSRRYNTVYLKEKIGEQFVDNLGRTANKILRYYADSLTTNWEIFNVDYLVKTNLVAERVEDNLRYIKMVFPNDVGLKWLGNKFITVPPPFVLDTVNYFLDDWKYTIKARDAYYNNGTRIFDSTLLITHIQDSTAITKTYSAERYARSIGMVYKEFWLVEGQINIGAPWEDRAEKGFILRQYAIDYGKE
ncbi:MAG TPA: hypothetical protein PKK18_09765 [Chitinophagales bacterium]|nr:hypothetical protein [Chitinophagales bacterium]HMW12754.1 hypothetical protein [Chitinophagales bacterium]HMX60711.1 hypothetical protein [Chitinophagales bacterium]HMY23741.1 hypothetical protein [Chitinophagales bacterium]HMZ34081.1 hypothetical protein [Chitinophagales bacterium]